MNHRIDKIVCVAVTVLTLVLAISGCGKKENPKQISNKQESGLQSNAEPKPETLGLPAGTEKMGKDPLGRDWFRNSQDSERWMYDPKDKTLHKGTKSADGKWKITNPDGVTAESLGLEPGAEETGKDPLGRYWFKLPGPETRVYDPKEKQFYRATKNAEGKWTMEKVESPKP